MIGQRIWRTRANQEILELYRDLDIAADIKKQTFEMYGTSRTNESWKGS